MRFSQCGSSSIRIRDIVVVVVDSGGAKVSARAHLLLLMEPPTKPYPSLVSLEEEAAAATKFSINFQSSQQLTFLSSLAQSYVSSRSHGFGFC